MILRLSATLLISIGFFCFHYAVAQSEDDRKVANDSAQHYLDIGQLPKAKTRVDKIIPGYKAEVDAEWARTYLIKGDVEEAHGFFANALSAYRQGLNMAEKTNERPLQARALNGMITTSLSLGDYDSILVQLEKSITLDSSDKNQVSHHLLAGRYWYTQNQHDKALPFFQQAYEKAKRIEDRKQMAIALTGMGGIYFNQEPDMKRALDFFSQAISLLDSAKHANFIARGYARMANAYMVLNNGPQADRYLMRAKKITDVSGNLPVKSYVLSSLAILKAGDGKIPEAIEFAQEPLQIKRQLGQLAQLQNDLLNLSEWYMHVKKYNDARHMLMEGIATSKTLKDVVYMQYFHERFAQLDSLTGNYKGAYSHLKRASAYKDSALSLKRIQTVEQLREKYETEQKEKIIAEKELEIQNHRFRQALIIGTAALAVLILVVILVLIKNRHKIRLEKEKQHQDHVRLQTIVHTQEEVQQSIARDIHDGLVQVMGAAKLSLQTISDQSDKDLILNRIQEASAIMDDACMEARHISHQLLPYSLMKDGLLPALDELLQKNFDAYRFHHSPDFRRLDSDVEINLYRIAQELVNNTLKHAGAKEVVLHLTVNSKGNAVDFRYQDDGKGFNIDARHRGVGLTNIITRATLIGGTAEISSQPGKGIVVQITAPL